MIDTILCWIGKFLGWLDGITGNYLLALFIFAFIIEILMLPFGIKQQKNTIKQASLRPKELAIRKKYAGRNDRVTQQKMQEELQQMYQDENYNQFGGCLPTLLQLPIILALYQVVINPLRYVVGISKNAITAMQSYVSAAVEDGGLGETLNSARGTIELISYIKTNGIDFVKGVVEYVDSGVEAVKDIGMTGSEVFSEFSSNFSKFPNFMIFGENGINLGETPSYKAFGWLWLVPVLTFVVYFASMKFNRKFSYQPASSGDAATDKATGCSNNMMDIMMPAFSVYIAFIVPAAIGVYWIFKSIIGTLKSYILYKLMPLPQFTDEEYKQAEREYAGKQPKEKRKFDIEATKDNPNSLFHMDDEDYVSPEVEAEISRKLNASDPGKSDGPATLEKAPLKDESDKK